MARSAAADTLLPPSAIECFALKRVFAIWLAEKGVAFANLLNGIVIPIYVLYAWLDVKKNHSFYFIFLH